MIETRIEHNAVCDICSIEKTVMIFEHAVMGYGNCSAEYCICQNCFNAKMNEANPKPQTKFFVEVYVRSTTKGIIFEWKKVKPSQGQPYEFDKVKDAVEMVERCYPESCGKVRIVDSNGEVWKHFL